MHHALTSAVLHTADDYPDIEIVLGAGGISGDRSGTVRNLLGLTNEFFHKVYRGIMGKPGIP